MRDGSIVLGLTASLVVAMSSPSVAGNMVPNQPDLDLVPCFENVHVYRTDNRDLYVRYNTSSMSSSMISAANAAWANSYSTATTGLIVHVGSSTADIQYVFEEDYTDFCGYTWDPPIPILGQMTGLARCFDLTASGRCNTHEVYFDESDTAFMTATKKESLACHEFGHTVGLTHRNGGPLVNPLTCMSTDQLLAGAEIEDAHEGALLNVVY